MCGCAQAKARILPAPKRPDAATSSRQPWTCSLGVLPRYGLSSSFSSTCSRSESSRRFQTSAIVPPGRSTRAISASAGSGSNQWKACPAATASTLASSSGSASAAPATTSAADATLASTDRISASGSTAITRAGSRAGAASACRCRPRGRRPCAPVRARAGAAGTHRVRRIAGPGPLVELRHGAKRVGRRMDLPAGLRYEGVTR